MSLISNADSTCPHCTGKLLSSASSEGFSLMDEKLSSSIEHEEDCPMRTRVRRINGLAKGFLAASLCSLAIPGCVQSVGAHSDAFGLDNGTVGMVDDAPEVDLDAA